MRSRNGSSPQTSSSNRRADGTVRSTVVMPMRKSDSGHDLFIRLPWQRTMGWTSGRRGPDSRPMRLTWSLSACHVSLAACAMELQSGSVSLSMYVTEA
ncbi:hypothetical protein AAFF_G00106790 [Aldrovandia affinis]|uniref:Uncharacterized protein n=1 Tax=Aldrovandia affinis TaxID=143900 RepID=A0AAD7WXQ9_9TELE|nr:hypothetical protein AAFF_G00106790 [Aldrovandia affinis]